MSLPERKSELLDTHRAVQDAELLCSLGCWAVSAFQRWFTAQIDTVIPDIGPDDYDRLLHGLGYEKQFEQDISNEYDGRLFQYTKQVEENQVKR